MRPPRRSRRGSGFRSATSTCSSRRSSTRAGITSTATPRPATTNASNSSVTPWSTWPSPRRSTPAIPTTTRAYLTARRAAIVSTTGLARLAGRIDLGAVAPARRGRGASAAAAAGRRSWPRPSRRSPAPSTSISGSSRSATGSSSWPTPELDAEAPIGALKSPKSRLQEYTQRRTGERPRYRLVDASGPDHERSFRIEVWVDGELLGRRRGAVPARRRDRGCGPGDRPPARRRGTRADTRRRPAS